MAFARTVLSATLAFSLVACGGGGSSSSAPPVNVSPTPTPPPATGGDSCSLANRQQFVRDVLNEWYLFPDLLATNVNAANYTDIQDYIDALVAPARAQSKDRFFTYITSIKEENALIQNGSSAGFGIRLGYDTSANRVFVLEAFEAGTGFQAGMDRGTELLTIGGQSVASLMSSGGPQAVINALGPSDPGLSRSFTFRTREGTERMPISARPNSRSTRSRIATASRS